MEDSKSSMQNKDTIRKTLLLWLELQSNILLDYIPKRLSDEEITTIVSDAIEDLGLRSMKDIGGLIKVIMPKVQTRADGKMVNKNKRIINK